MAVNVLPEELKYELRKRKYFTGGKLEL